MEDEPMTGSPERPARPDEYASRRSTAHDNAHDRHADLVPPAAVCPFLRAIDDVDTMGPPIESPDPANRCAALDETVPQSLRQQELVCLTSGHVNCPRYLRGAHGPAETIERVRVTRIVTPATGTALAAFGLAAALSIGFVVVNGGLVLTAAGSSPTPSSSPVAVAESLAPTLVPSSEPSAVPAASPSLPPGSTPRPTPAPSPTPTPVSSETPNATPTSDRYKLLSPCPDAPNCYIYVVRSGDNLTSIANYFGVSLNRVKTLNPWVKNGLKVGRELRIPTPTR